MSEIHNQSSLSSFEQGSGSVSAFDLLKQQDRESAKKAIAARLFRDGVQQEEPVDLSYLPKNGERVEAVTPESPEALDGKVEEAVIVLKQHAAALAGSEQ